MENAAFGGDEIEEYSVVVLDQVVDADAEDSERQFQLDVRRAEFLPEVKWMALNLWLS